MATKDYMQKYQELKDMAELSKKYLQFLLTTESDNFFIHFRTTLQRSAVHLMDCCMEKFSTP